MYQHCPSELYRTDDEPVPPDEDMQVKPLEERQFDHMLRDVMNAFERGDLAIETHHAYVEQEFFEAMDISVERDVNQYGIGSDMAVSVGKPELILELEWEFSDNGFMDDAKCHAANYLTEQHSPMILYGSMHLWDMRRCNGQVSGEAVIGDPAVFTAEFRWRDTEPIQWR